MAIIITQYSDECALTVWNAIKIIKPKGRGDYSTKLLLPLVWVRGV